MGLFGWFLRDFCCTHVIMGSIRRRTDTAIEPKPIYTAHDYVFFIEIIAQQNINTIKKKKKQQHTTNNEQRHTPDEADQPLARRRCHKRVPYRSG